MKRAFTLIEILIVVVIIGLLSSSLMPKISSFKYKAENAGAIKEVRDIEGALDLYQIDHGTYPLASTCDSTTKTDCSIYSVSSDLVSYLSTIPKGNPVVPAWTIADSYIVPPGHPYGYVGLGDRYILSYVFVDVRDGRRYKAVKMPDGKWWMAENLNYKTSNSSCYGNVDTNCGVYGRLYTWDDAQVACPASWELPSGSSWAFMLNKIESMFGGVQNHDRGGDLLNGSFAGRYISNITDIFGFSALFGGFFNGSYGGITSFSTFRTSTQSGSNNNLMYYLVPGQKGTFNGLRPNAARYYVRCVRD